MGKSGYDDTPLLPNSPYCVHDHQRPAPAVVTPGSDNSPPSDAVVLFDGTSLDGWQSTNGGDAPWQVGRRLHGSRAPYRRHREHGALWRRPVPSRIRLSQRGQGREPRDAATAASFS